MSALALTNKIWSAGSRRATTQPPPQAEYGGRDCMLRRGTGLLSYLRHHQLKVHQDLSMNIIVLRPGPRWSRMLLCRAAEGVDVREDKPILPMSGRAVRAAVGRTAEGGGYSWQRSARARTPRSERADRSQTPSVTRYCTRRDVSRRLYPPGFLRQPHPLGSGYVGVQLR